MSMVSTEDVRRLFRMPRDGRVTMAVVNGYEEFEDMKRGYWANRPTTDVAYVFAGPRDKMKGTITVAGGEVKVEITFPARGVETRVS